MTERVDLGNVRGSQGATGRGISKLEYIEAQSDLENDVLRAYYSDHTPASPSYEEFTVVKPIIPRTNTVNNDPTYKDYLPTNKAVYDALSERPRWDTIINYIRNIEIAEFVTDLPTTDIDKNKFYFLLKEEDTDDGLLNTVDVYAYMEQANGSFDWEQIDVLEFNIKNYYTKTESDGRFAPKTYTAGKNLVSHSTTGVVTVEDKNAHDHGNLKSNGAVGSSNNASKNVVTDSNGKITTEDKPTIPTKVSQLTNDSNFVTITDVNGAVGNIDLTSKEDKSNKVGSWSSSTGTGSDYANNVTYPSEKLVKTALSDKIDTTAIEDSMPTNADSSHVPSTKLLKTELNKKADSNSLSTVATSGSYTDLSNKPSFTYTPTITSSTSNSYKLGSLSFGDTSTDIYAKNIQVVSSNTYPSSSSSGWNSLRITGNINKTIGSVLAVAHTGTKSNASGAKLEVNSVQEPIYHNGTPINGGIINPNDTVFFVYSDNVAHLNSNTGLTSGWELWGMYSHPSYTARTGRPNSSDSLTPSFGETFTVTQFTSDTLGHISGATDRTITIPSTTSSGSVYGLAKASSTSPKMDGTATTGSEVDTFARGDHIHPKDTTKQDKSGLIWQTYSNWGFSNQTEHISLRYNDYFAIIDLDYEHTFTTSDYEHIGGGDVDTLPSSYRPLNMITSTVTQVINASTNESAVVWCKITKGGTVLVKANSQAHNNQALKIQGYVIYPK